MRPAQLRALLVALRAGGVLEYETESRGVRTRLRLGAAPATVAPAAGKHQQVTAEPDRLAVLRSLGVTDQEAQEVLAHVS